MTNIEIQQISVNDLANQEITDIALSYANAFGDPSGWNERTKCPTTGQFFGIETTIGEPCSCCGDSLLEAYPPIETGEYILGEISKPEAIAFLGRLDEVIIGASWGYVSTPQILASNKWRTQKMQQLVTTTMQELAGDRFFYGSETFVDPDARNMGAATAFVQARINAVSEEIGLPIVGRTLRTSPMSSIYLKLGFQEIIMNDSELEDRALYIYYPQEE